MYISPLVCPSICPFVSLFAFCLHSPLSTRTLTAVYAHVHCSKDGICDRFLFSSFFLSFLCFSSCKLLYRSPFFSFQCQCLYQLQHNIFSLLRLLFFLDPLVNIFILLYIPVYIVSPHTCPRLFYCLVCSSLPIVTCSLFFPCHSLCTQLVQSQPTRSP